MLVFTYGALMSADVQKSIFGHTLLKVPFVIKDFEAEKTNSGELKLYEKEGGTTLGLLVVLKESEVDLLDKYEHRGTSNERVFVKQGRYSFNVYSYEQAI